ncbi:MAG TPA: hypothetical protein VLL98_03305 [Rickettsiales bacterium]|nr:hypothetical protein [Rickettsiales bacterium]
MDFLTLKQQQPLVDKPKRYAIFTRGCFDCLHLGHFVLLTSFLVESSKILKCNLSDIDFYLSLASQDAEIAKGIKYHDTQDTRYQNLLNTKLLYNITVDRHTMPIFDTISSKMNCFCIGNDQDSRTTFQTVIEKCHKLGVFVLKLPSKVSGISSTIIRNRIKTFNEDTYVARKNIESDLIFDEETRKNILLLKEVGIIDDSVLKYFNLDSNARTRKMREVFLSSFHTKDERSSTTLYSNL